MNDFYGVFIISCIAVLAPLLVRLPALALMPVVALELMLGVLVGPSVIGLVTSDETIKFLGELGLVFLFFQAGFEFKQNEIGLAPLRLGALAWLASFGLAIVFVGALYFAGLVRAPLLVALVLPTTAFGILIPVLRQSGDLDSDFGHYVLGSAAMGELAPLILASIALAQEKHHIHQTILSILFLAIAVGTIFFLTTMRSERLSEKIVNWLGDSEILPVRASLLILLGFVALANSFGVETVVGAYTAGMAVAMLVRGTKAEVLEDRLTMIGSGFFIPLFFVASGVAFDLPALVTSPASLARFALFSLVLLVIRLAPLNLYKKALAERDLPALALLSSTTLPLVVAITYLGVRSGQMAPENATALVGAAIVTVTVYPALAFWLRTNPERAHPDGAIFAVSRSVADWFSAMASRFLTLMPESLNLKK
ncbi:cation:proton antiporter [Methylocystis sp. WRRC1]|uniref:cation:proton antiporter n=1 Tax=Methylocystis sp. WRRC1 TaxID=1732014 RepID=UPI001D1339C3|nr:cation:proton antiporter [Methylocystis sp. WRRC1]MCC3243869.1 cation:proton antiporter [Methylocystis sp. WRRC1]